MSLIRPFILAAFALTAAVQLPIFSAYAQTEGLGIAATVNDDIITTADVEARIRFILATTGITDSAETRQKMLPQVIRQLADEALQMQEAKRDNITISDREIDEAITSIEKQRGIPAGGLIARLKTLSVPIDTFRRQVRAQLAWSQIAGKKLRPLIRVSEEEIERARQHVEPQENPGTTADEVKISVLALPVDKQAKEPQMRALAEKLSAEIQRGIPFESVARELGTGGAAATSAFWVAPAQLDKNVSLAIEKLSPGHVSGVIRTADGYSLVKLVDRKGARSLGPVVDSEMMLKDVLLKLKNDAAPKEVEVMLQIGREVSKHPGTCLEEGIAGVGNVEDYDINVNFTRMRASEMTPAMRDLLHNVSVGGVTQPFATPEGIRFFMLCEKTEAPPKMTSREEAYSRAMQERMALESEKFMRNLRREAFMDVKL